MANMINTVKSTKWMNVFHKDVHIYASKLATCCGMNMYEKQADLITEFAALLHKDASYKTFEEKVDAKITSLETNQREEIHNILTVECKDAVQVNEQIKNIKSKISDPDILRFVEKKLYTDQGIKEEDKIREKVQIIKKVVYEKNNKFATSKIPIITTQHGIKVYIGGRHDGIDQNGNLIEIKNRMKRFLGVPKYELVQIHAYMFIFQKTRATIIENYLGDVQEHIVEFDDEFWKSVKSELALFIDKLESL